MTRELPKNFGDKSEALATSFLEQNGFVILERNFFARKLGEIDIIAKREGTLHFIEVKSGKTDFDPVYNITPALFIDTISGIKFNIIEMDIIIGSILPVIISIMIMILLYTFKMIKKDQMIISSLTLGFGSNAFFGIAYFDSLYGGEILEFAVLTAGILGILGVILSVVFLEYAKNGKVKIAILFNTLKSPPVFAIFIGLGLALFGLHIEFFDKASALLGKTAGGLAIFVLGMFIYDTFSIQLIKTALPYVLLRAILLPVTTFSVLLFLPDITDKMYTFLFQQSGIPAAIALAIIAQKYAYHEKMFSSIVMLSSLFSFLVLGVLYNLS